MKENKITIVINRPVEEIFEFTINPKNTPLWITHIKEEIADSYPPKVGTIYKNTTDFKKWDSYTVINFEKNKTFTMKSSDNNYSVRYTYKRLDYTRSEMEYFEWVTKGEIENPFTQPVLKKLKDVIEKADWPEIIRKVGFDFSWAVEKVWKLKYPVEDMGIKELEWHFEIPFHWHGEKVYNLKSIDIINDLKRYKKEHERTMKADLTYPIDIMENKGRWLILDGLHRLMKAKILGMKTVKVRKIPRSEIPNILEM